MQLLGLPPPGIDNIVEFGFAHENRYVYMGVGIEAA